MKVICKVVRLRGKRSSAAASLAYVYAKGTPMCGHSPVGVFTGVSVVDAPIFTASCDDFGLGSEVCHVVISSDQKPSPEVTQALVLIAQDWARIYADGRAWVAVSHTDTDHGHIHLVMARRGPDGRCLSLVPQGHRGHAYTGFYGAGSGCGPWRWAFSPDAGGTSSCRRKQSGSLSTKECNA